MKIDPYSGQSAESNPNDVSKARQDNGATERLVAVYERHGNMFLIVLFTTFLFLWMFWDVYWSLKEVNLYFDRLNYWNRVGFFSAIFFELILIWCSVKCLYLLMLTHAEEKKVLGFGLAYWLVVFYAIMHFRESNGEWNEKHFFKDQAKFLLEEYLLKTLEFVVILRFIGGKSEVLTEKYRKYAIRNMAYDFSFGLIGVKHQPRKLHSSSTVSQYIPATYPDSGPNPEAQ
jgi:hypothetical protein